MNAAVLAHVDLCCAVLPILVGHIQHCAQPQRSEVAAQHLCWPSSGAMARPAAPFVMADGSQQCCCSASTGAWGTASCSVARWKNRAEGVLQSEMETHLDCVFWMVGLGDPKIKTCLKTTNVFVVTERARIGEVCLLPGCTMVKFV